MSRSISTAEIKAYEKDGVVLIRNILTADEVADLRDGIELNIANPSELAQVASNESDPGWFFEDFCTWQENPAYQRIIFESDLAEVASKLMCSKQVRLFHDHMLVKNKGTLQRTPWHQDLPYYNIQGRQNISFWIPVDPVPFAWSLEFAAGSHRDSWYLPRTFLKKQAKWFPEGSLEEAPEIGVDPDNSRVLSWELEPGDAVAFHMLTLHAGAGAEDLRRVFSVRMIGDDILHAPREWRTSPEFPGLSEQLPAGVPMDHKFFPLTWPKHKN
ncbi:MAG: phytanoyl-CoA dioxygenase family protein [SAR324 cluster bacterium]|nr:phytanoyl-CoA dioxygenase family protein [SAR324 cluster bacterium]MBL7034933.1 phytanoyl-CoA dioxygenase family protein [SAR324 cluster bacterium]